jgi:hypothetical protein
MPTILPDLGRSAARVGGSVNRCRYPKKTAGQTRIRDAGFVVRPAVETIAVS